MRRRSRERRTGLAFGLAVAGLFSFLVKSGVPYKAAKARPGISEDDDMVG